MYFQGTTCIGAEISSAGWTYIIAKNCGHLTTIPTLWPIVCEPTSKDIVDICAPPAQQYGEVTFFVLA